MLRLFGPDCNPSPVDAESCAELPPTTVWIDLLEPTKEEERRPHHCIVTWGDGGLPRFDCVIESLSIKYTMFSEAGIPLRATCTVKLKEADVVSKAKDSPQGAAPAGA